MAVTDVKACGRVVTGLLAALVCAAAASCGADGGPNGTTTSGKLPTSETFTTPDPEPTTPTTSTTSRRGNPSIRVARLPVGGDSTDDDTDPTRQCAHITWIASREGQIPQGSAVEITRVIFDPPVFEVASGACTGSGRPSCLHYIFRPTALRCDLGVRARAPLPEDANPSVGFAGLVYCPDNDSTTCRSFLAALETEQQLSVTLNVPQLPPTTTDDTTETTTDATGGG